jgi:hypothetical protein
MQHRNPVIMSLLALSVVTGALISARAIAAGEKALGSEAVIIKPAMLNGASGKGKANVILVDSTTGAIAGTVTFYDGITPLTDVEARVVEVSLYDTTDLAGYYFIDSIAPGAYSLLFSNPEYGDTTIAGIQVVALETTSVNVNYVPDWCLYVSGDLNNDGDATPFADISYGVRYFKGIGPPPPDPCGCAADVNGNGAFTGTDITHLCAYWKGVIPSLSHGPGCPPPLPDPRSAPSGFDEGIVDSIIVGNLDLSPITAEPGDTVDIPIWVRNDENVEGLNIAIASDDNYITERLAGTFQGPLADWADRSFGDPEPDHDSAGFTSQAITGWANFFNTNNEPINSNGGYLQIAAIRLVVNSDLLLVEDTTELILGEVYRTGETAFGDPIGLEEWGPEMKGGLLVIIGDVECGYTPGDVNNVPPVNGIDITYGVAYLKGGNPPPVNCGTPVGPCPLISPFYAAMDVNGTCNTNGIDITYFVSFLKGGPGLLFCPNCQPSQIPAREINHTPGNETAR